MTTYNVNIMRKNIQASEQYPDSNMVKPGTRKVHMRLPAFEKLLLLNHPDVYAKSLEIHDA